MLVVVNRRRATIYGILVVLLVFIAASVTGGRRVTAGRDQSRDFVPMEIPVLNYHKVDNMPIALSITPAQFDKQMAYLAKNGYHTITPDQLLAYLRKGQELPEKPVLITFDDGYADNYTNAYPIMKKYGFTAIVFLVTDKIGRDPRFMNWEQVKEMQEDGFFFGSHTVHHQELTKMPAAQALAELTQSRQELAQHLGQAPLFFAYPGGYYDLSIEHLVRQAGYRAAFTVRFGVVSPDSDVYALERIPLYQSAHTFRSFFFRLQGAPLLERLGVVRR